MTTNNRKCFLSYFNRLVDQYKNTDHHSINKKSISADYSTLTEKIETNSIAPNVKVNDRVRIFNYKSILNKDYTGNWSRELFIIDSVLKTNSWAYKIKYLNAKKTIGRFYEKELID